MSDLFPYLLPLDDPADVQFKRFATLGLRRAPGARLKAAAVLDAYQAWVANERHGHSMGFRKLKRSMRSLGYLHFYSDGSWYRDVEFCELPQAHDAPDQAFMLAPGAAALDLLARIDAIAADLAELRLRIVGGAA